MCRHVHADMSHVQSMMLLQLSGQMSEDIGQKVRHIAAQLHLSCVRPDRGERVRKTGAIAPKGSLKYLSCRQAFAWCGAVHEPRYFTKTAVKRALERLLDHYRIEVPLCPAEGLTRTDWLRRQTQTIQHLCKRAVKNSLVPPRGKEALAAMDDVDTQPWSTEDAQRHVCLVERSDHYCAAGHISAACASSHSSRASKTRDYFQELSVNRVQIDAHIRSDFIAKVH